MLKDYTDQIIKTASRYKPQAKQGIDWSSIADSLKSIDTSMKTQDLASALESGDQEAINKARSALDPTGYANFLDQQALRAEDRQWEQEKLQKSFDLQKELAQMKYNQARNLAEFKAGLGDQSTTAMRNMQYLVSQGYTPQEAAALYYGGQNPTMNMSAFGKKGMEKLDENAGKNYAADLEEYRNMTSKMPELLDTVEKLNELGKNATYTESGKALDSFRRQTGLTPRKSAIDRGAYVSMIDNQVLPLLRDTFGAQFTEREGNTLRQTLGDPDTHPKEKEARLNAFIRQKQKSIESKARKIKSYNEPIIGSSETIIDYTELD